MKKLFSMLVAFVLVSVLAACNNEKPEPNVNDVISGGNEVASGSNEETLQTGEISTGDETPSAAEFKAGLKGEGPYTVTTAITTFTVPEGFSYEVKSAYVSDDAKTATVEMSLTPTGTYQFAALTITNQGMVKSYEDAVQHTIKLQNLNTYKEGKSELLNEVEYNGIKYQTIKISTEYGVEYFLAGYKDGREIQLKVPEKINGLTIDDAKVKALMDSLSVVPL